MSNGGPAPESITEKIYELTQLLTSYKEVQLAPVGGSVVVQQPGCTFFIFIVTNVSLVSFFPRTRTIG